MQKRSILLVAVCLAITAMVTPSIAEEDEDTEEEPGPSPFDILLGEQFVHPSPLRQIRIPDLGRYNKEGQQPLDFAIWQAADQTWQMVACCRKTGCLTSDKKQFANKEPL